MTTLPILGGLSILAAIAGVSLGRATVDQIDPAFFREPSGHFYSDLVPNRPSGNAPPEIGDEYVQPDYAYAVAPYCVGCTSGPVAYQPPQERALDARRDRWQAEAVQDTVVVVDELVREPPPPNRQWIERYTDYGVAPEPDAARETAEPDGAVPVQAES